MKSVARSIRNGFTARPWRIILLLGAAIALAGAGRTSNTTAAKPASGTRPQVTDPVISFPGATGMNLVINSASISATGTIAATYTLTDVSGLPLDTTGATTTGVISVSLVAAYIPNNAEQYTAYTTKVSTGAAGSFTNAGPDSGGTTTPLGSGKYTYTFKTLAPTGFDPTATTTIGVYAKRTLTAYGLPNEFATATFNFVPNGNPVTHVRDIVETATCDGCHDELSHHGGQRRQVALCILCHQPQSHEESVGNTVDFKVMIHKLHFASELPSVLAGGTYSLSGTNYSTIVFPATAAASDNGATYGFRCTVCHSQTAGAAQANYYATHPSALACGSCHDNVNFSTGVNHPGGPQPDDTQCANCHTPQGELPFDASIIGAHSVPEDLGPGSAYPLLGGVQITLNSVANGVAGKAPTVNFTLQDGSGNPLPYAQMASLTFVMAGPTTDYGYTSFGTGVTTPGYVTETTSASNVACSAGSVCTYTFTHAIPANAKGSYAISFYGSRNPEVLLPGDTTQQTVTESPFNNVIYFSVDGTPVVNRRTVVQTSNCNACHYSLELHNGTQKNTQACIMCHNPSNTDAATRPSAAVAAQAALPALGIDFNLLVHRIHDGANLKALGASYTVIGAGGTVNDFTTTWYPAFDPTGNGNMLANCSMCHASGSEQTLPVGLNATANPQAYINPAPATTAACTGCHADATSSGHASVMTSAGEGETCNACHSSATVNGITPPFSVATVHTIY
jgi:OmcA/MtrC family decaheme c-type cytochrome